MPPMPEGSQGRHPARPVQAQARPTPRGSKLQAQMLGSGAILGEVVKAQQILEREVRRRRRRVERDQLHRAVSRRPRRRALEHAASRRDARRCRTSPSSLAGAPGVFVAASDYMKILPGGIDRWLPRPLHLLGTDGFGRSESRAALRDFFEVDARFIVFATLHGARSRRRRSTPRWCRRRSRISISTRRRRTRRSANSDRDRDQLPVTGKLVLVLVVAHGWPPNSRSRTWARHQGRRRAERPRQGRRHGREGSAGPRARDRQGDDRSAVVGRGHGRRDQGQDRRQGDDRPGRADAVEGGADRQRRRRRRRSSETEKARRRRSEPIPSSPGVRSPRRHAPKPSAGALRRRRRPKRPGEPVTFTIPEPRRDIKGGDVLHVLVKVGDTVAVGSGRPRARDRQGDHRSAVVGRRHRARRSRSRPGDKVTIGQAVIDHRHGRRRPRRRRRPRPAHRRRPRRPRAAPSRASGGTPGAAKREARSGPAELVDISRGAAAGGRRRGGSPVGVADTRPARPAAPSVRRLARAARARHP